MGAALRLRNYQVPLQSGELARLKVIQGPDRGLAFSVNSEVVLIGRAPEVDVVLADPRVSRKHARIFLHQGSWWIQDLGGQGGILSLGRWVKQAKLGHVAQFGVGETLFEWVSVEAGEEQVLAPPKPIELLRKSQQAFEKQREKIHSISSLKTSVSAPPVDTLSGSTEKPATFMGQILADPKKARMVLLLILGGGGYLYYESLEQQKLEQALHARKMAAEARKREEERQLIPSGAKLDDQTSKNLDTYFKLGFREFRENNFLRALNYFETVLQIDPRHHLANRYKAYCLSQINEEVKDHLRLGRRDEEIGRLESAKGHYQAIKRLLFRNQVDPQFIQAKEALERVETKLLSPGGKAASTASGEQTSQAHSGGHP